MSLEARNNTIPTLSKVTRQALREHVVSPAKREIKKLDRFTKIAVLKAALSLGEIPRPAGYVPVVGQIGLYRIHVPSAPKYRVIYHIHDQFQTVIIVTVRLKGKTTYHDIPIRSLTLRIQELEEEFLKQ